MNETLRKISEKITELKAIFMKLSTKDQSKTIVLLQLEFYSSGLFTPCLRANIQIKKGSWIRYPVWQHTFVSPSAFSRRAVVSYWRKYVHEVLVNRLGGLSLPRKSVVRLTDRPDMTLDVYRGRKTTMQQQCNNR